MIFMNKANKKTPFGFAARSTVRDDGAAHAEIEYFTAALEGKSRLCAFCRLFHPFFASTVAFAAMAVLLLAPLVISVTGSRRLCYVYEDGSLCGIALTTAKGDAAAVAAAGVELLDADEVESAALGTTELLTIHRAADITVIADGQTTAHRVLDKTVAQTLDELKITLGEDDRVDPSLDTELCEGDTVTVRRVTYETREAYETVASCETEKLSPLISDGATLRVDNGSRRDGEVYRVYRDTYVDGVLESSEITYEKTTSPAWNGVTLKGDSTANMSTLDGSQFTDIKIVDNAPESYERVIENGVCTAYSFSAGTWGASGMMMIQGFVAVNTDVIPYGSLLYITSPSGNFTYGWAIAADVGEAMMAGYVDIDLFFETYRESALFGKHKMNIYVVKQLTQSELEQYCANEGLFRSRVPE